MLRFVSLYILILCSALPLRAGLIDSLFINAPQDVLPLLGLTERLDLLDLYDYRLKAEVENRLGGRSLLEHKDSCMLRLRVSDAESWEMHCVQGEGGALLICLNSVRAGGEMTRLSAYNLSWQPIKLAFPKPDCKHFLIARRFAHGCRPFCLPRVAARPSRGGFLAGGQPLAAAHRCFRACHRPAPRRPPVPPPFDL